MPLNRKDGSYFGTLCALDPLPAQLSEEVFDIFHLLAQLLAYELEQAEIRREREAEMRALEDFLAIAGHDLNQPLTSLYGRLQLLERAMRAREVAPELIKRVEALEAHAREAISLGNTLLDVARFQVGAFALDKRPSDLVAMTRQLLDDARLAAPTHEFQLDAPNSLLVEIDPMRFQQVLRNLLSNATKYTPAECGPIVVSLTHNRDREGSHLNLQVQDKGIGVAKEDLPHLFKRRYRATTAIEHGIGGTGLGLYIARQIVEAHGGAIWAEQTPGGGLTVHVTLPYQPD